MARLLWNRVGQSQKVFDLGETCLIGRGAADCDVRAKSVSRQHARIHRRDEHFVIVDLGSTNGTVVNGERISSETRLTHGDMITLGEEHLEFHVSDFEGSAAPGQPTEPLSGLVTAALQSRSRVNGKQRKEVLPRRLGKFQLLERLGQGGMGTVYRAIDLDSKRQLAVKFIRSQIGRREAFLDFFHNREAVLAREINHPNVIQIYEYGVDADHHFISMEFVQGESLYQTIRRQKLSPSEVIELLRQATCGIAAAHRQGVVHSDIKPANVLLATEATPSSDRERRADGGGELDDAGGILEFENVTAEGSAELVQSAAVDASKKRELDHFLEEALVDPPYFERRSETRFLRHYLQRTQSGRGYLTLVEGESGVGKDRLVSEFLEAVQEGTLSLTSPMDEALLYELDCSRIEGLPLLYEQIFSMRPGTSIRVKTLVDDLIEYFRTVDAPVILRLLNFGGASPLYVELIGALCAQERRLFLVATLDPDELRENAVLKPFLETVADVTKQLYLRPMTEYQIQRYLQQLFPGLGSDTSLAADVCRLSGGNFYKLLSILQGFVARGILRPDGKRGVIYRPRAQTLELEEGKNLHARYRALGKVEQRVLEHAAFIGKRFLFDTLLKFSSIDETALFFIVRTMITEGFFTEESRTWYGFTNHAFQSYIADQFPRSERPHLHRAVCRLLGAAPITESAELLQLRAQHYCGCREFSKAVQTLLEGAHLARGQYQSDLAREMFQQILAIYRELAEHDTGRRAVVATLRDWFRRDGNWYEILGDLASQPNVARVKIADFGISFRTRDQDRGYRVEKTPILGTPRYLAPERIKGESGGPKADVFALGVLAYEMIVRRPPFPGLKGKAVMVANLERTIKVEPRYLEGFPEGTELLLAGMLERKAERRWDAERVLQSILKLQLDLQAGSATRDR